MSRLPSPNSLTFAPVAVSHTVATPCNPVTPLAVSNCLPSAENCTAFTVPGCSSRFITFPVRASTNSTTPNRATACHWPFGDTASAATGCLTPGFAATCGTASVDRIDTSAAPCGPFAPASTQAFKIATSSALGCGSFFGGMNGFSSFVTVLTRKLSAAFPGTIDGPLSPPRISAANVSTDRSPSLSDSL